MNAVYGSGLYKQISADLTKLLPDVKSFSVTNLRYMKHFYELYFTEQNPQQLVEDLKMIFQIPWGHHTTIIDKCKNNRENQSFLFT